MISEIGSNNGSVRSGNKSFPEPTYTRPQRVKNLYRNSFCESFETAIAWLDEAAYGNPDSVHGANIGPTWVLTAPDGPHVGIMNLAIREHIYSPCFCYTGILTLCARDVQIKLETYR